MHDETYYSAINCSGMSESACFASVIAAFEPAWLQMCRSGKDGFVSGRLLTCGQRYRQGKAAGIWCLGDPRIAV